MIGYLRAERYAVRQVLVDLLEPGEEWTEAEAAEFLRGVERVRALDALPVDPVGRALASLYARNA